MADKKVIGAPWLFLRQTNTPRGILSGGQISPDTRSSSLPASFVPPQGSSSGSEQPLASPVFDVSRYGDEQLFIQVYSVAADVLVLPRPTQARRVFLLIVNDLAAGIIRINYDAEANAGTGIPVVAGGNFFRDTVVPQNDIHIFSPGAGNVVIAFMNLALDGGQ